MNRNIQTTVWHVDIDVGNSQSYSQIVKAATLLRAGETVAFPTETVYGLGANALSQEAVEKIFAAKGRPSDNPLIVHIGSIDQLSQVAREVPPVAERLMDVFWPGPLTLILPRQEGIAPGVTAGLDTVGVRMPRHPVALALIRETGLPIAAPSANRSGKPSPTTAEHVWHDLAGRIAGIVDGGPAGVGVESTVLDVTVDPPMILRPGGVTREQLVEVIGAVAVDPSLSLKEQVRPRSPGMKYAHYAPRGELWVVDGEEDYRVAKMAEMLRSAAENGHKTGVLLSLETYETHKDLLAADVVSVAGSVKDLEEVARRLYAALRMFDQEEATFIVAEAFPRLGLGSAVMNRLEKAAGGNIIRT